jgi:hypothetical protein
VPVSGARWQHGSQILFAIFKITKTASNSTTIKAIEKICTDLEFLEF